MRRQRREDAPAGGELANLWADAKSVIIVPLSGTPEAKVALPIAKTVAAIIGATVHILHVAEETHSPKELIDELGVRAGEVRGMLLNQASGPPAKAIAREAAEKRARLIVMATYSQRRPLSPNAESVLKQASCPVIFVRPESRTIGGQLKKILLPLDGTPTTAAAIEPAIELATRSKAELDVLYVVAPAAKHPEEPGTLTAPFYVDQPQHEWPAWASEFMDRFCRGVGECPPPASTRLFMRRGEPAAEILRFAADNDSDLIVLVWRGEFKGKRAMTIKDVLRAAPCPVLVLHTKPQADDFIS